MCVTPPFCAECEMVMRCRERGVIVKYTSDMNQSGRLYECPGCGIQIIANFASPYFSLEKAEYTRR